MVVWPYVATAEEILFTDSLEWYLNQCSRGFDPHTVWLPHGSLHGLANLESPQPATVKEH